MARHWMPDSIARDQSAGILFVDVQKAFDSIRRPQLFGAMLPADQQGPTCTSLLAHAGANDDLIRLLAIWHQASWLQINETNCSP
eukprot:2479722-Prorocentrum_lima.AAC.1